jgi:hypothetical protein
MGIRRVVTGHNESGVSFFVGDELVAGDRFDYLPGWEFYDIWGGDETPQFPDAGEKPSMATYFPRIDGFRFCFSVVPPENTPPIEGLDMASERAKIDAALPGMLGHLEEDFMHTTDTLDFELIVSGEVYLRLSDGTEKLLKAGDTVVQNGTRHLWRNAGTVPAVMAVFMVGAHRKTD